MPCASNYRASPRAKHDTELAVASHRYEERDRAKRPVGKGCAPPLTRGGIGDEKDDDNKGCRHIESSSIDGIAFITYASDVVCQSFRTALRTLLPSC